VVTGDENFAFWYELVGSSASWTARLSMVIFVRVKAFWVCVVIDDIVAIFKGYAFTRKTDNALYDVFVVVAKTVARVFEDDNFTACWYILFALNGRPCNGEAINNKTIACVKGRLHAWPYNVITAKNEGINKKRADNNTNHKDNQTENVFCERVSSKERGFHELIPLYGSEASKAISESVSAQ
jgi:hypothetical protein